MDISYIKKSFLNLFYINFYYTKRIDDVGAYTNASDVPYRFIPCMITGLAFYLSEDEDNGLECYYDAWCWYESVAMQMAFKFAILDVIIISALIVRLHLYPQPNP